MSDNNTGTWLANIFIKQREIIEAAETPFSKLAIFILPILAPAVPAFMTGLHLFKLFLEMFTFKYASETSFVMSSIIALVLELLGYVGAISFIKSLFSWIKERREEFLVPFALNGVAYGFYLLAMFLINVQLGKYFGTSAIINNIVGLLSFITVPTSLLAANHLNSVSDFEREEQLRKEATAEQNRRWNVKHGVGVDQQPQGMKLYQTNSRTSPVPSQSSSNSSDWRVMKKTLNPQQIRDIGTDSTAETARKYGRSERTARNWQNNVRNGNV